MPGLHHIYLSMIPIGFKPGIVVAVLLAGAVTGGDIENHYIGVGAAAGIFVAIVVSSIAFGRKFQQLIDQGEASKLDRDTIKTSLLNSEAETKAFRDKIEKRLLEIEKTIAGLECNKGNCPLAPHDTED